MFQLCAVVVVINSVNSMVFVRRSEGVRHLFVFGMGLLRFVGHLRCHNTFRAIAPEPEPERLEKIKREDLHTHRFLGLRTVLHTKSTYTMCTVPGSDLHIRGSCLFV